MKRWVCNLVAQLAATVAAYLLCAAFFTAAFIGYDERMVDCFVPWHPWLALFFTAVFVCWRALWEIL